MLFLSAPVLDPLTSMIFPEERSFNISLHWSSVTDAEFYDIHVSMDGTTYSVLDTVDSSITDYTDTVNVNGTYHYNITARSGTVESKSSNSESISITILVPSTPSVTTNLTATTLGDVMISWNATSNTERYLVYRSNSSVIELIPTNLVANITDTEFNDTLTDVGMYFYVVFAVSSQEIVSDSSNVVQVEMMEERTIMDLISEFIFMLISIALFLIGALTSTAVVIARKRSRNQVPKTLKDCEIDGTCDL